jgi:hypothetical protein
MFANNTISARVSCMIVALLGLSTMLVPALAQMYEKDSKAFVVMVLENAGRPDGPRADSLLAFRLGGTLTDEMRAVVEARANALIEVYNETDDPEIKRRALRSMTNGGSFAPAAVRTTLADFGAELCETSKDGRTVIAGVKLVSLSPSTAQVPALVAAIKRKDYAERSFTMHETLSTLKSKAVLALGSCGEAAVPALTDILDNAAEHGVGKLRVAAMLCRAGSRGGVEYVLDAARDSNSNVATMAITYLPYVWPLLESEEKNDASQLMDRLLEHENISIRSMAARWALKCDKDRFAERVQTLHNTDASEHVKKNARDALMEGGLIEKDESAAFADQVQQFFIERRKE